MAYIPKKKRLEKTEKKEVQDDIVYPQGKQRFYCCRCGTSYSRLKGFFSVSHSPMYRGLGHLPICVECVDNMYNQYCNSLGDDRAAMRMMCMKLDIYWNDSIYDAALKTAGLNSRIRSYVGKTNLASYIDKTFDDTLMDEAKAGKSVVVKSYNPDTASEENQSVDPAVVEFWGPGYDPDFYEKLERRYRDWTGGKEIANPSERSLYRQICLLEVMINRDAAQGKSIDRNVSSLNALLGSMNLKPAQQRNDADAELEKMPLGVGIQKWEYSRPLPATPGNKKDVNGVVKNITTWFLGHACKMVGLRNSYCKMYEDAMEELRVKHPEYDEEDDDTTLNDIFAGGKSGGDDS